MFEQIVVLGVTATAPRTALHSPFVVVGGGAVRRASCVLRFGCDVATIAQFAVCGVLLPSEHRTPNTTRTPNTLVVVKLSLLCNEGEAPWLSSCGEPTD